MRNFRPSSAVAAAKNAARSGFTMVEIAISLAVIGVALVAIIGVLPLGLRVQRANREQTVINQDATVFMAAIRNGTRGLDDLTNYVFLITNTVTTYDDTGQPKNPPNYYGYTYTGSTLNGAPMSPPFAITNGYRIVGLLSTPEYTDANGLAIPNLSGGGLSNHIVAYVRSLSGPAVEKPPQLNDSIVREDSFSYRMLSVNAPLAMNVSEWSSSPTYPFGAEVFYVLTNQVTFWRATNDTTGDIPGLATVWQRDGYSEEVAANSRELQLSFYWPQLPNGNLGPGRQTYRTMVAGQLVQANDTGQALYFCQPQSFLNVTNLP